MGVGAPLKYVNRDLNSQFGIEGHDSHFRCDGNLPLYPCLLWGAEQSVTGIRVMHMTGHIRSSTQDSG